MEEVNLGLPSRNVEPPKSRFEFKDGSSRGNSISIPVFAAAWASLLKQFIAEDKGQAAPESKSGLAPPTPIHNSDPAPEYVNQPVRIGGGAVSIAKVAGITLSSEEAGLASSAVESSDFQFVRTPILPARPSLNPGDSALPRVRPSNDNHQASPSGGSGGGGGGGGGGGTGGPDDRKATGGVDEPNEEPPKASNRRPAVSGPVNLRNGLVNQSIIITIGELLTGASDPDGDNLAVLSLAPNSGMLEKLGPDRWLFTPARDQARPVTFQYEITDGSAAVSQVAHSDFLPRHGDDITGTDGNDVLIGTPLNDVIDARKGNDTVYGRESNDAIWGGDGNDRLIGGDGGDVIWGGPGNDVIFGGAGNDTLFGEDGNDTLFGEDDNDHLFGGSGDDVLDGGSGDDRLDGDAGADTASGDTGNDVLDGGAGDDRLDGGAGEDILLGGTGDDNLSGGDNNDKLTGEAGDDHLDGDAGDDDLNGGEGDDHLDGGTGDDHLAGGDGDDVIDGGPGSDAINAGDGDDVVLISLVDGSDVIVGGQGNDTISLEDVVFDSTIDLPDGLVIVDGISSAQIFELENIRGGRGKDHLVADDQVNIMVGGDGNDSFVFRTLASVANNGGPRDHIMDFSVGDRLDLSRLGQELDDFAGQKLFFVAPESAGFDEVGAITYHFETISDEQEITVVTGNLDSDSEPEFEIVLDGHHELTEADIVLEMNSQNNNANPAS